MAVGAGWNALVKPAINAARQQAATATRNKIAAALTGAPTQDVADALAARLAQQNGLKTNPPGASAAALTRALMRAAAAKAAPGSNNWPAPRAVRECSFAWRARSSENMSFPRSGLTRGKAF
jgi:hypothetical protein